MTRILENGKDEFCFPIASYPVNTLTRVWVTTAVRMNVTVATIERGEKRASPQMP